MVFHTAILGLSCASRRLVDQQRSEVDQMNRDLELRIAQRTAALEGEIQERIRSERERQDLSEELVKASRIAGMAEAATTVLHNVGNGLNSANVAATLLAGSMHRSKVSGIQQLAKLLEEHQGELADFLETDERGQRMVEYLGVLGETLGQEREEMLEQMRSVTESLDHVKQIIAQQQTAGPACHRHPRGTPSLGPSSMMPSHSTWPRPRISRWRSPRPAICP